MQAVTKSDPLKNPGAAHNGVPLRRALKNHGERHILQGGQRVHQIIGLEDISDLVAAHPRLLALGQVEDRLPLEIDLPLGWYIQRADLVEERTLSRATGPHDGEELAPLNFQRNAFERPHLLAAHAVEFFDIVSSDNGGHRVLSVCRILHFQN